MHIAVVAGEVSGDKLGAPLLESLKKHYPSARFSGVGGEMMSKVSFNSLFPLQRLAVMGLVEVIRHLPDLLAAKKELLHFWQQDPPDVFIGIDAPDFNLKIAAALHQQGVKTVHYVSPSLWAWKEKRIFTIAKYIDLVLCLFPFETAIYDKHGVKAVYVGHPLRDRLVAMSKTQAREKLGLDPTAQILGIFPGSRKSEIQRLSPIFVHAFQNLKKEIPTLQGVLSNLQPEMFYPLPKEITPSMKDSALLMSAADVLLVASGTITLEAALLNRPLVSAYRVNPLTASIARRLLKINRFSLPNLLTQSDLVPECIQEHCTPEKIAAALLPLFSGEKAEKQLQGFGEIQKLLPQNVSSRAVEAIGEILPCSK